MKLPKNFIGYRVSISDNTNGWISQRLKKINSDQEMIDKMPLHGAAFRLWDLFDTQPDPGVHS